MNTTIDIQKIELVELSENEMIETDGGIALALAAMALAGFAWGFDRGRELAR